MELKKLDCFFNDLHNWASEASPTLGCSIEILRDIFLSVCRMSYVVCLSYVKLTA